MLFNFLKYIKPTWYFNLKPTRDWGYFPLPEQLKQLDLLPKDTNYLSETAQNRDWAYAAFQIGYINRNYTEGNNIWQNEKIPTKDEYRFLRKNFHPFWVIYTLMIRILTGNNPFKELYGFFNSRSVKRVDYSLSALEYSDYDIFESTLVKSNPLVSIIIPTLNRYVYLKDVLKDLENQSYTNFEVIIVDQSEPFQEDFYKGWDLNLRYWYQKEKALWKARNEAIKEAKGEWILLYDDDSRIETNWVFEHLKTIDFFKADISSGVSLSVVGAKIPKHYSYFRWSDQLDTGNVLLKKDIFTKIGFFDLKFEKQRMGDGEFGLRAYLNGYKNISNPKAKRIHLKVSEGGLRQMGSWDGWRPKKIFGPRPVPSVLYLSRKYFGDNASRLMLLKEIIPAMIPYRFKGNKVVYGLSFLLSPLLFPILIFQMIKSWQLATIKLKE